MLVRMHDVAVPRMSQWISRFESMGPIARGAVVIAVGAFDIAVPLGLGHALPVAIASLAFGSLGGAYVAGLALVLDISGGGPLLGAVARTALLVAGALAIDAARRAHRALLADATRDPLTGLWNRRGFARLAALELARMRRLPAPLSVAYLDLDAFKALNDEHGHAVGDRVLAAIGRALASGRASDIAARVGGDELVLLMPMTDEREASNAIERLKGRFARELEAIGVGVTFTAGIVTFRAPPPIDSLLDDADRRLRESKRPSRLRIVTPALALALFASPAYAQITDEEVAAANAEAYPAAQPIPGPVRVEILGGTTAPLDLSIHARVAIVDRFLLGASAGMSVYGDLFGAIVEPAAGAQAATVVRGLANGAFVGRVHLGVRPFEGEGFEIMAGYTVIQRSTTFERGSFGASYPAVNAALLVHALHVELAWTIVLADQLLLRPAIGWTHAVGSEASLASDGSNAQAEAALDQMETEIETAVGTYGMTPTLSLSLGYRF